MIDTLDSRETGPRNVVLVIESAKGERREVSFEETELSAEGGVVIGRSTNVRVVVPSGFVSGTHCRLNADSDGSIVVTDLGSRNGTFIDGRRLNANESAAVTDGSRIELGDITIGLRIEDRAFEIAPAPFVPEAVATDELWQVRTRTSSAREEVHEVRRRDLARSEGIVVGRNRSSADIEIGDPSVSRAHCRIWLDGSGTLMIADLGSSNGTLVQGRLLAPNEAVQLSSGATAEIGTASVSVVAPEISGGFPDATVIPGDRTDRTVIGGEPPGMPNDLSDATVIGGGRPAQSAGGLPDATVIGGAPAPSAGDLSDATVIGGPTPSGAGLPDATVIGGSEPAAPPGGLPDATVIGGSGPTPPAGGLPDATVIGGSMDAPGGDPAPSIRGAGPAPAPTAPPPAAPVQPAAAAEVAVRRPSSGLSAIGSLLIPAAIVACPVLILVGDPNTSLAAARYLVAAVLVAIVVYAGIGMVSEFRRRRTARAFAVVELERLRSEVALTAARASLEQERTASAWSGFRKYRVARKHHEGGDICSFYLVPHDGKPHPPFEPGQHITFQLKLPDREKPVVRCYTLSDSPFEASYYRVSIKRVPPPRDKPEVAPGLSSNFFHGSVQEGDILDVKAPSGKFWLDMSRNTPVVLIGGGIGLTPVLSMVNAIAATGSTRETWVFYGVRNGDEHIMKEHLESIARNHENVRLQICYSNPRDGIDTAGVDFHHAERVSVDLFKRLLPSSNYEYYICGPPPMMESVVGDLREWGVPESAIHFEAFGPATVKGAKAKAPADAPAVEASVTFSKSNKTVAWSADFDSILEFAEANGIVMDSGCRAGNCGSCICALKSGRVRYVESPGIDPDDGSCLTCISVPDGDLVLEA